MADKITKTCDFQIGRGRNVRPHGVPSGEPTVLTLDYQTYEIDLCNEHRDALVKAIEPFTSVARPSRQSKLPRNAKGRAVMRAKGGVTFTTRDVRQWLAEQGREVPNTGRIANEVIEEYKVAHRM